MNRYLRFTVFCWFLISVESFLFYHSLLYSYIKTVLYDNLFITNNVLPVLLVLSVMVIIQF